jgi:hypothetical protein
MQTLQPGGNYAPRHEAIGEIQTPRANGSLRGCLEQLARRRNSDLGPLSNAPRSSEYARNSTGLGVQVR